MNKVTDFLEEQKKGFLKSGVLLERLNTFYIAGNRAMYNATLFDYISYMEVLALTARELPALSAVPDHIEFLEEVLKETHDIKVETTPEGWINIKMPCLLPGKTSKTKKDFSFYPLYHAMKTFAEHTLRIEFLESVIAVRHVYDRNRPIGMVRDNDNVDTKTVVDIIKSFLLPDDNGMICSHFYDSKFGQKNMTDIYVMPRHEFNDWWEKHC